MTMTRVATALVIAGSDSGGGAGIQADVRTLAAFDVHGATAVSAVTAQNTRAVTAIHVVPSPVLIAQLEAVFGDFDVRAIKIGMLATPAQVRAVGTFLAARAGRAIPLVLDPVMVATTGAMLGRRGIGDALVKHLLARAKVVTPNIPEAEMLLDMRISNRSHMLEAARRIRAAGARSVLLKGAHLARKKGIADLFADDRGERWFEHARIRVEGHGTGCSLASAIAAGLARGRPLDDAVADAIAFVQRALSAAYCPGRGRLHVLDHSAAAPKCDSG